MPEIDVYPLPLMVDQEKLSGAIAVVIDQLRATTTLCCAAAAGAKEIVPLREIEETRRRKADYPVGEVLLGGERQGVRIEGFDLGNSPRDYKPETIGGKTLLFTTTNGTVAMHAARAAKRILLASLVNAGAVVRRLAELRKNEPDESQTIAIICAGTEGEETEEDLLVAGCLIARLVKWDESVDWKLNPFARHVKDLWNAFFLTTFDVDGKKIVQEFASLQMLTELLRQSRGGRNLIRIGHDADIIDSARVDSVKIAPEINPSSMIYRS